MRRRGVVRMRRRGVVRMRRSYREYGRTRIREERRGLKGIIKRVKGTGLK